MTKDICNRRIKSGLGVRTTVLYIVYKCWAPAITTAPLLSRTPLYSKGTGLYQSFKNARHFFLSPLLTVLQRRSVHITCVRIERFKRGGDCRSRQVKSVLKGRKARKKSTPKWFFLCTRRLEKPVYDSYISSILKFLVHSLRIPLLWRCIFRNQCALEGIR